MSAIARVAFHIDSLKQIIPEHEGNFIIDSYFAYLTEDRRGDAVSNCTDDCGELAKKEMAACGLNSGEDELEAEADAAMALRLEAQRRAQLIQPPMTDHPMVDMTAGEELASTIL